MLWDANYSTLETANNKNQLLKHSAGDFKRFLCISLKRLANMVLIFAEMTDFVCVLCQIGDISLDLFHY
jgi:hypothetical protein